jgi:hypothetical protein
MPQEIDFDKLFKQGPEDAEILFVEAFVLAGAEAAEDGKYVLEFSINGKEIPWEKFCVQLTQCYADSRRSQAQNILDNIPAFVTLKEELKKLEQGIVYELAKKLEDQLGLKKDELLKCILDKRYD